MNWATACKPTARRMKEGDHPDRDGQFAYLNAQAAAFLAAEEPVVSVDAKKKELVGDFKNPGREWHPQGEPEQVRVYDFPMKELGRATPYGVYDLGRNAGWVNVGIDHDTAAFAVESIRRWWNEVGTTAVSHGQTAADQCRWRRKQRFAGPLVEMGAATVG